MFPLVIAFVIIAVFAAGYFLRKKIETTLVASKAEVSMYARELEMSLEKEGQAAEANVKNVIKNLRAKL
ncbi:MAG TPA: hypothetical protein VH022_14525 [Candidatus Acidoferrum sp.]|nr:hypothetical protein [Candidatus Acidoferrum sp.]